jgi:hypothetical protein
LLDSWILTRFIILFDNVLVYVKYFFLESTTTFVFEWLSGFNHIFIIKSMSRDLYPLEDGLCFSNVQRLVAAAVNAEFLAEGSAECVAAFVLTGYTFVKCPPHLPVLIPAGMGMEMSGEESCVVRFDAGLVLGEFDIVTTIARNYCLLKGVQGYWHVRRASI